MLPIGGRPLLEHTIGLLRQHGVKDIAINLYHNPQAIVDYLGDGTGFGVRILYSWEAFPLGTAGAVKKLGSFLDEPFFVLYGDVLTDMNLSELYEFHLRRRGLLTMAVHQVPNPTDCGIVAMEKNGRIVRFVEKPQQQEVFSDLANAGIYVVEPSVVDWIPQDRVYDFGRDLFPKLLAADVPIYSYPLKGYLRDIGSPTSYKQAQSDANAGVVRLAWRDSEVPRSMSYVDS